MRLIVLLSLLTLPLGSFSQSSCCSLPATDEFAQLADDAGFRAKHDAPLPYRHMSSIGQLITYPTSDGKTARAWELQAQTPTNNYLLVVHEWWGLNDYVKKEAEKYYGALGNVNVIALDLYDGQVADNREDARKYMQSVTTDRAHAIIQGAFARAGKDARFATVGWCFGGGWSLQTSLLAGEQAAGCVMYYGMPEKDVEKLKTLKTDVLGLFAANEQWINPKVVAEFEANMKTAGKNLTTHSFDAQHAFANPSNPRYDQEAAGKAWELSLAFLKERLN